MVQKNLAFSYSFKSYLPALSVLFALFILSGCVVYEEDRYARLYDACDQRAGVCYRTCDDYSYEEDRFSCQADCSREADKCFADINRLVSVESAYYATQQNYYGRYGAWYYGSGYRYGPHGRPYGYPYTYRGGYYDRGGYDRDDDESDENDEGDPVYPVRRSDPKPNLPIPRAEGGSTRLEPRVDAPPVRPTTRSTPKPLPSKPVVQPRTTPKPVVTPKPSRPSASPPKPSTPRRSSEQPKQPR